MISSAKKSWEKFLHPETLKNNLIAISLFIAAFEMFRKSIIDKPQIFYSFGFDEKGPILSEQYKTDVLSRSKSKLCASLLWLKEMGAIEQTDIAIFDLIRQHRNEVAHELMEFLASVQRHFYPSKFQELILLFAKIEKWWIVNFELSIDPYKLPEGANPDEIVPGQILILQLMLNIALGDEPEAGYYYKAFQQS